jgi:hypothetical protein
MMKGQIGDKSVHDCAIVERHIAATQESWVTADHVGQRRIEKHLGMITKLEGKS